MERHTYGAVGGKAGPPWSLSQPMRSRWRRYFCRGMVCRKAESPGKTLLWRPRMMIIRPTLPLGPCYQSGNSSAFPPFSRTLVIPWTGGHRRGRDLWRVGSPLEGGAYAAWLSIRVKGTKTPGGSFGGNVYPSSRSSCRLFRASAATCWQVDFSMFNSRSSDLLMGQLR
jgi:hypothetical protein